MLVTPAAVLSKGCKLLKGTLETLRAPPLVSSRSDVKAVDVKNSRALHGSVFWFCTDGDGFQEPRVQMVRGYGFHIIAVGARMVPEKIGLLRSGLRFLVKSAVWLRSGLRFQVKSAGRFRSGLHSTSFVPNGDISHAFNFRHAFTATNKLFYISTSTVSPAAASCANCTSWRHWLRLSCCAAMTALYF